MINAKISVTSRRVVAIAVFLITCRRTSAQERTRETTLPEQLGTWVDAWWLLQTTKAFFREPWACQQHGVRLMTQSAHRASRSMPVAGTIVMEMFQAQPLALDTSVRTSCPNCTGLCESRH